MIVTITNWAGVAFILTAVFMAGIGLGYIGGSERRERNRQMP